MCHRSHYYTVLLVAVAILSPTSAFQSFAFQYPLVSTSVQNNIVRRINTSSLPYTSKSTDDNHNNNDHDVPTTLSIHSLLENGRLDDAIVALKQYSNDVPASTYHSILEACCAGSSSFEGSTKNKKRKQQNKGGNKKRDETIDRIGLATDILQLMDEVSISTPHAYEIVISGYARRGMWKDALKTLVTVEELFSSSDESSEYNNKDVPTLNAYQTVLISLAKSNQYTQVNELLTKMRRRNVRPTVYTYNSLLKECASSNVPKFKEALSLLSQCQREPGVTPDIITYTTTMRACARAKQASKSMEIFRVVKDMNIDLDVYIYTTAMDACAKGGMWKRALKLLDEMKAEGITPNEVTYGVAVTACGNGGQWELALELLDHMKDTGLKINTITYNSAIAALSKAARNSAEDITVLLWEKALDLINDMEEKGVRRDSFTFSSAISTCGSAGRWEEAVDLIKTMKRDGTKPNRVAYTSAISACASSRQWDPAYELFNEMKNDGIHPDLVAYNALIGAGMAADKPMEVYNLWHEMCKQSSSQQGKKVSPDIVTLTEVIATLDSAAGKVEGVKANRERVDEIFVEAVERGLILRKDSLDTSWEVDLSCMSFPIARAACRYIFKQITERSLASADTDDEEDNNGSVKDLNLITGAHSRMREYVRGVLRDELRPAVYCVVPKMEQGTLLVKKQMMQNYINGQAKQK